jgi:signal transduction histidine kinase
MLGRFRLSILIVTVVCCLSLVFLVILNFLVFHTSSDSRKQFMVLLAKSVDESLSISSEENPLKELQKKLDFGLIDSTEPESWLEMWVVDAAGTVLYQEAPSSLPDESVDLEKPIGLYGTSELSSFLSLGPPLQIVRLSNPVARYLIVRNLRGPPGGKIFGLQAFFILITFATSLFLAIFLLFCFLRKKAKEAEDVIERMGKGELGVRFSIKSIDHFSGLMAKFNELADEIERLVLNLRVTEKARSMIIRELGHDLRTPITSIRSAAETLIEYKSELSEGQTNELHSVLVQDSFYLSTLIDQLTFLNSMDEPTYSFPDSEVSLHELLEQGLKKREMGSKLRWSIDAESLLISANVSLMTRLVSNALDNAFRYAVSEVNVSAKKKRGNLEIIILDDGPGLSTDQIMLFGKRDPNSPRVVHKEQHSQLGSVIMSKICRAYGGSAAISNRLRGGVVVGAELKLSLRLSSVTSVHEVS